MIFCHLTTKQKATTPPKKKNIVEKCLLSSWIFPIKANSSRKHYKTWHFSKPLKTNWAKKWRHTLGKFCFSSETRVFNEYPCFEMLCLDGYKIHKYFKTLFLKCFAVEKPTCLDCFLRLWFVKKKPFCVALCRASAHLSCSHFWTSELWAGEQLHQVCNSQGSPILYRSCVLHHMTLLLRSPSVQKEPSIQKTRCCAGNVSPSWSTAHAPDTFFCKTRFAACVFPTSC